MSDTIKSLYQQKCDKPSDINEHLPVLRQLAAESTAVAELGVRLMVSTWAFLDGLASRVDEPARTLFCVDIENVPGIDDAIIVAAQAGITMEFKRSDSATTELPPVDLLFIDSWHTYAHLKRELAFHHHRVNKYIVMHDTEAFKFSSDKEGNSRRVCESSTLCVVSLVHRARLTRITLPVCACCGCGSVFSTE